MLPSDMGYNPTWMNGRYALWAGDARELITTRIARRWLLEIHSAVGIHPISKHATSTHSVARMKQINHKHHHHNAQGIAPQLMPIRFEFTHPTATAVSIAGTFNNWHPTTIPMQRSGNGHWLEEAALAPGIYEYCLVVDGQWMPDPLAKNSVPNPFGGKNSILEVTAVPEVSPLPSTLRP